MVATELVLYILIGSFYDLLEDRHNKSIEWCIMWHFSVDAQGKGYLPCLSSLSGNCQAIVWTNFRFFQEPDALLSDFKTLEVWFSNSKTVKVQANPDTCKGSQSYM